MEKTKNQDQEQKQKEKIAEAEKKIAEDIAEEAKKEEKQIQEKVKHDIKESKDKTIAEAEKKIAEDIAKEQFKEEKQIQEKVQADIKEAEKEIKQEKAAEEKQDKKEKRKKKEDAVKKDKAVVNAYDLPISTKQCIAICAFIKNKKIPEATSLLEDVVKKKIAVPFKGEIPHRKNTSQRIMSGRYPVKASRIFIKLLKTLSANSQVNGLDIDGTIISIAKADLASRPYRRFGSERFKRTNVVLISREINEIQNKKSKLNKRKLSFKKPQVS